MRKFRRKAVFMCLFAMAMMVRRPFCGVCGE